MKKVFTLLFFVTFSIASFSQLRVALIGGPQSTTIKEDNTLPGWSKDVSPFYTNRVGGNVGLLGEVQIGTSKNWFLHPGLLYQTKGRKFFKINDSATASITDTLSTTKSFYNTYIEIPLNLAYKVSLGKKARFFISAGPYLSFFYNGKQSVQARFKTDNTFKKEDADFQVGNAPNKIKTIDFGINGRAGFDIGNVLITGFFSQGLKNFYTAEYDGTFKHNVIGASVGFWLNKTKLADAQPKDTDKDGVIDNQDICPTVPGSLATWGCPDMDRDSIADLEDKCPEVAGLIRYNGCPIPDTDKDGIHDEVDKCPEIAGTEKYEGCPIPDTDGDKISDEADMCPDKAGPVEFNGCPIPDSDGDGLVDTSDKCPQEKGSVENNGCPEIKEDIMEKVNFAAKNIFFESKLDKLNPKSFDALNDVVLILKNNPELNLQIEGYTDNTGNVAYNLSLSAKRAKAVKQYLVEQGIEEARLKAIGFGQKHPIADNKTIQGRAANRRVELKPGQQ